MCEYRRVWVFVLRDKSMEDTCVLCMKSTRRQARIFIILNAYEFTPTHIPIYIYTNICILIYKCTHKTRALCRDTGRLQTNNERRRKQQYRRHTQQQQRRLQKRRKKNDAHNLNCLKSNRLLRFLFLNDDRSTIKL